VFIKDPNGVEIEFIEGFNIQWYLPQVV
jgi:hypothetical protein